MSKIENTSNHKDVYSVWKDGMDNFYSTIEKSIPQFHQAATNLFQEYAKALNNASSSIVEIQREFATKAGIKSNLSEASINLIHDSAEKINKSLDVQSKMSIASIDATQQNIKTWNENSSAFVNISKSIADSLISPFNPKI
ncbi:MAG: hypothetical protein OEM28_09385 [Nitrosopumilus sp.]|nr:hypothetical protein [Nitrosopumilus sp.]MDH3488494.1 hypothetical protein [Nitrosopumilus sp.]